jgi:pimeloyl-ACP methyl ester carboxylesterase
MPAKQERIRVQDITYPSAIDDIPDLGATLAYPVGGRSPVVVIVHGGIVGSRQGLLGEAKRLARKGLFVINVSLRGRDGSSGAPDRDAREAHDVLDAVRYVSQRFPRHADAANANIIGWSGGGATAMACAVRFPDTFRSITAFFPPCCWDVFYRYHTDSRLPIIKETMKGLVQQVGGVPRAVPARYAVRNPALAARNCRAFRLRIFLDSEDPLVPRSAVEPFVEEARRRRLKNFSYHLSRPGDQRRWHHAGPEAVPDIAAAEDEIVADILARKYPRPALPSSGALVVPGYLVTTRFSIWLGDGAGAVALLRYRLTKREAQFSLTPLAGSNLPTPRIATH